MELKKLLARWPLIQQLQTGARGTGPEAMSQRTRNLRPKTDGAEVARSICPYCGVGCGQLVYHKDGKLISIEGDPQSPISRGHLCPKGADTYELHTHPGRLKKVKYRRAIFENWEELDLETPWTWSPNGCGIHASEPSRKRRAKRRADDADQGSRPPWRGHSRQRRKLPDQKTLRRRSGNGLHQQPSPDMTQLHRARSGHLASAAAAPRRRNRPEQRRRDSDHGIVDGGEPSGRLPVGDGSAGTWREDHPCRPALHTHLRDGGYLGATARRQRHYFSGRDGSLRSRKQ